MQVYIRAASKKELNERIAQGKSILAIDYSLYGGGNYRIGGADTDALPAIPHGTVIKIYDRFVCGSPYAKAYGTWDANKRRVK